MFTVVHVLAFSKVTVSIFGANSGALEVKYMNSIIIFIYM